MVKLKKNKLNVLLDGQLGSTGKGLFASYISSHNTVDIAVSNSSPNAGHTFFINDKKYITRHIPISGILNEYALIYLCPGAIINKDILFEEIDTFNIDVNRLFIHPRCAVITESDILNESDWTSSYAKISSTQSGVGSALASKIKRHAVLANHCFNTELIKPIKLQEYFHKGYTALMETSQGFDLSLNSGLAYPYCTSREITVSSALSDAQVHPNYLGNVIVTLRTFPIRVGNLKDETGKAIGYSGPFYNDSEELSWDDIGVKEELTTNTKRVRRVCTFSISAYQNMLDNLIPDYIFLNFCNYLDKYELDDLLDKLPEVTHLGFGKTTDSIITRKSYYNDYFTLGRD